MLYYYIIFILLYLENHCQPCWDHVFSFFFLVRLMQSSHIFYLMNELILNWTKLQLLRQVEARRDNCMLDQASVMSHQDITVSTSVGQ